METPIQTCAGQGRGCADLERFPRVEARLDEIVREPRARRLADASVIAERPPANPVRIPRDQDLTDLVASVAGPLDGTDWRAPGAPWGAAGTPGTR